VETLYTFDSQNLGVPKFTALHPLSLLISCKLSFPVVGLKMSSLPTSAFDSPKNFLMIFKEFIEYTF
jgi:hypothetical protein